MSAPAVEVEQLVVRFGDYAPLEDVTLALPEASLLAVLGPNGAGKSTFLKVLVGLIQPSAGAVRLFGRAPAETPPEWISYLPQVKTLDRSFPARAIELVGNGLTREWPSWLSRSARDQALEALEQVGAAHLARRPLGRLSGGELQRVYLARSLARQPRLLVLDEPVAGIDAAGEKDMQRLLEGYRERTGATVVMVTHDWETAYHHATHVLVLSRRLVAFGPPTAALTDVALRRAFGHVDHAHGMHLSAEGRGDA